MNSDSLKKIEKKKQKKAREIKKIEKKKKKKRNEKKSEILKKVEKHKRVSLICLIVFALVKNVLVAINPYC